MNPEKSKVGIRGRARLTVKFHPSDSPRSNGRKVLCIMYDAPPIAPVEVEMFDAILPSETGTQFAE